MGSLILIRHATTASSESGHNLGQRANPPLTAGGEALAARLGRALAAELAGLGHDEIRLVTSPARRCRETLERAAAELGRKLSSPEVTPALLEIDYGDWDGLSEEECARRDPELRAEWERDPYRTRCPDGESGADVAARAFGVFEAIDSWLDGGRGRCALAVSHNHVIRLRIAALLGIDLAEYRRAVTADPAGYSIITFAGRRSTIRRVNASPPASPPG